MQKAERVAYIEQRLAELFPRVTIPLSHKDSYTLLIAVLLSAQCTDKRVNTVTPALFALADHPAAMCELPVAKIESLIRPCGLAPKKAKAIAALSHLLIERHRGEVPQSLEALESLPGVGHKTASVVMVQAFGQPAFPVDTHIHRLAQVWELTSGKNVRQTEKDLKNAFAETTWASLHLRMIYYGRNYCRARDCNGLHCQICQICFPHRKHPYAYKRA